MKRYILVIKSNLFWICLAAIMIYWGASNNGIIRIGAGVFILYKTCKSIIRSFKYAKRYNSWISKNQGELVLFYPTKKVIQEHIRDCFISKLPYRVLQVYYDGPKLVGDVQRSVVFEMIKWNSKVKIHSPAILKVIGDSIQVEELNSLKKLDLTDTEYQKMINQIELLESV